MARVISDNDIFYEVPLSTFHESEVQAALTSQSRLIYPGFLFTLFNFTVQVDDDSHKADFALIESEYRSWWVGEVEMLDHNLERHVLPQVRAFLNGEYDAPAAEYLAKQNDTLDKSRLTMLVSGSQPGVLVVANKFSDRWASSIQAEGAKLAVFELFRSDHNRFIFRLNGFDPPTQGSMLSECSVERSIPSLLRVHSPNAYPFVDNHPIRVKFGGLMSEWGVTLVEGKVWLRPRTAGPLALDVTYSLRSEEGHLLVIEQQRRSPR